MINFRTASYCQYWIYSFCCPKGRFLLLPQGQYAFLPAKPHTTILSGLSRALWAGVRLSRTLRLTSGLNGWDLGSRAVLVSVGLSCAVSMLERRRRQCTAGLAILKTAASNPQKDQDLRLLNFLKKSKGAMFSIRAFSGAQVLLKIPCVLYCPSTPCCPEAMALVALWRIWPWSL